MNGLSRPALMLAAVTLSGCASQGGFPSLAPRAVERGLAGGSAPALCPDELVSTPAAPTAPVPVASDAQLRARVSGLVIEARQGQTEFAALVAGAGASVAGAGAAGTDGWIAAQQDLSRLEAARRRTVNALAELDAIGTGLTGERPVAEEDREAVLAAEREVRALGDEQQTTLDNLSRRLAPS